MGDTASQHLPSLRCVFAEGPALTSTLRISFCPTNVPGEPQNLGGEILNPPTTAFGGGSPREPAPAPGWAPGVREGGSRRESSPCLCPDTCPHARLSEALDGCQCGKAGGAQNWSGSGGGLRAGPPPGWRQAKRGCLYLHSGPIPPLLGARKSTPSPPSKAEAASAARDAGRLKDSICKNT